ncbi:uncharacterized protein CXQ87_002105 [Candidozyma duobushaemuli]|uniref:BRCT domain-containing protein n=2 Tax=Candidozyma TaxID=3303203 RepID=A0ABX8IAS8_9ASCO|nr:uncharacterized protein CXQ87_002105 [[Candida] duobushaemulonis]PVH13983.1 hypothetical protein CXQ87_002105 [[Candida] duobushaemulonis]QWU87806.1 hypothetical protein CA3LBN_002071 [[Candida] haemuloni]
MVEVSLTVGKLDASLALLLTKDHHLIEFPTILLPNGVKAGSIVKIKVDRDLDTELEEKKQFQAIQDEIINTFGKNLPKAPQLRIKNVTQTSCVLEWDDLDLGTASLKNLVLFRDGKKLGAIPQALTNKTTKLSGLPIDQSFKFHLRLDTTAGVYKSDEVEVTTHKMTDLSGITVCLGDITPNDQFNVDDIQAALKNMGAHHPAQETVKVDTTHFITTRENKQNPEFVKANDMNIPIIRPEWLKACERERRIVGVRDFYVKDCSLPDILSRDYWKKASTKAAAPSEGSESEAPVVRVTSPSPDQSRDEPKEESKEELTEEPKAEPEVPEADKAAEEKPAENEVSLDTEKPEAAEPATEPATEPESAKIEDSKLEEASEEAKTEDVKPEEQPDEKPEEAEESKAEEKLEEPKAEDPQPEEVKAVEPTTQGELSEVDLNEANPESGVAEHTNLAEDLAKEEAKETEEPKEAEEAKEAEPEATQEPATTEISLEDDAPSSGPQNGPGKKKNKRKSKK